MKRIQENEETSNRKLKKNWLKETLLAKLLKERTIGQWPNDNEKKWYGVSVLKYAVNVL